MYLNTSKFSRLDNIVELSSKRLKIFYLQPYISVIYK